MNLLKRKKEFYALVAPSHPNEWEVEEIVELLESVASPVREALLRHVPAVWPISNSLCYSYLTEGGRAGELLGGDLLPVWVRQILDHYEQGGLLQARAFMADVEHNFYLPLLQKKEVRLVDIQPRLQAFIRGISGKSLVCAGHTDTYTDTETIYLPESLSFCGDIADNLLLYKFISVCQWGFIALNSFGRHVLPQLITSITRKYNTVFEEKGSPLLSLFSCFPRPHLAQDLFTLLELRQVMSLIQRQLPGLMQATLPIRQQLADIATGPAASPINEVLCRHYQQLLTGHELPEMLTADASHTRESLAALPHFYEHVVHLEGQYEPLDLTPLLSPLRFEEAGRQVQQRRLEAKKSFIAAMGAFLHEQTDEQDDVSLKNEPSRKAEGARLSPQREQTGENETQERTLMINNEEIALPEELRTLIAEIEEDLGALPQAYMSAAAGFAGRGTPGPGGEGQQLVTGETQACCYDEWDYRRAGYRKNWCIVIDKELTLSRSTFVPRTLTKHRGVLMRICRQFEMMRTNERFAKRRRYGDDVDLDALVDALADQRAGLAPSSRLFVRLLRDQRDIATLFLVDMSSSTEGWVSRVIKEALVLLCEGMAKVGDRYGIYGFSGMRRSRSEVYHVKHIDEPYDEETRQRIGSIAPRDYTRMGPPIRHLTKILGTIDARVRLLMILSDGKPEDYDDYKGEYAIEDTRKALHEARGRGIRPFCITVDREAHDYLNHMYGKGNSIFVDKLEKLPARLPEIYRQLTR